MAAQRSRARCGMIRHRADVAARKTGCQIAAPTRECRSEPLEATSESRRFQATSVMASCCSIPKEPPWPGVNTVGSLRNLHMPACPNDHVLARSCKPQSAHLLLLEIHSNPLTRGDPHLRVKYAIVVLHIVKGCGTLSARSALQEGAPLCGWQPLYLFVPRIGRSRCCRGGRTARAPGCESAEGKRKTWRCVSTEPHYWRRLPIETWSWRRVIRRPARQREESLERLMAAHLIDVSVASTKRLEAVVAGVGRVQQVTKEACHVESD